MRGAEADLDLITAALIQLILHTDGLICETAFSLFVWMVGLLLRLSERNCRSCFDLIFIPPSNPDICLSAGG